MCSRLNCAFVAELVMLAVNCAAGRSLWQECILLAVVCFSRQMYMLVLEELCVVGMKFVGWSLLM